MGLHIAWENQAKDLWRQGILVEILWGVSEIHKVKWNWDVG